MATEQERTAREVNGLLDLFDLMLLWKRKWSVMLSMLVAAGLAAVYVYQQTPVYEVTARVLVQRERFGTDQERLVRTDPNFLATQSEILRSPVVVQPALQSLDEPSTAAPTFEVTDAVMRKLRVSSVDDANVLKLTYRSDDSAHAAQLLLAIVDTYREYSRELQQGGLTETLKVLAQRDAELRAELEMLEQGYYELRKESPLIGQGREAFGAHLAMLEQLGRRVTEMRSKRIDMQTQIQTMLLAGGTQAASTTFVALEANHQLSGPNSSPPASGYANLVRIQEELWKAEIRAAETSQVFGPYHPEMRGVDEEIALWRRRLDEAQQAFPELMSQQLAALQKSETDLTKEYEAEFQKVKLLDSSMLKEQHALAEIQRVQDIHDVTATQLRELQLADNALTNGQVTTMVRVLESPDATAKLVWPLPAQFISLCAAMGFVAGCVLITLAERVTKKR